MRDGRCHDVGKCWSYVHRLAVVKGSRTFWESEGPARLHLLQTASSMSTAWLFVLAVMAHEKRRRIGVKEEQSSGRTLGSLHVFPLWLGLLPSAGRSVACYSHIKGGGATCLYIDKQRLHLFGSGSHMCTAANRT